MRVAKACQRQRLLARELDRIASRARHDPRRQAKRFGCRKDSFGSIGIGSNKITPLILAEGGGMRGQVWMRDIMEASAAGERHFSERNKQAAIRDVVNGLNVPRLDERTHEIARLA